MQSIQRDNLSWYADFIEKAEQSKVFVLRKAKVIVAPLSFSLPIAYVTSIMNKSLKIANYFRSTALLPNLANSLDSMNHIIGVGSFINITLGWVPCLTEKNFDEEGLKVSIKDNLSLKDPPSAEIWSKRIVKQVKISLNNGRTKNGVKNEVADMLIKKGVDNKTALELSKSITLRSKNKELLEKIYTFFFAVSSFNSVLRTLEKWDLIILSKISEKIGDSRLATSIVRIMPKVTKYVSAVSISNLVRFSGLAGSSVKMIYDCHKLYQAHRNVSKSIPGSTEHAKWLKERTSKIWAVSIGGLTILGIVAPLVLSVNPVALLTYEIAVATFGLVNVLRV